MLERCSRSHPCVFCGDVGYDMRVHYPEQEEIVHWCHKTKSQKGQIVTANDGNQYICVSANHRGAKDIGTFDLWIEYLPREQWIEKRKRLNPDNAYDYGKRKNTKPVLISPISYKDSASKKLAKNESVLLSPSKRDAINRYFSSITVLEKDDRQALLAEWSSSVVDVSHLLTDWPIRSLVCPDKIRFASNRKYQNPSRKSIISKMMDRFGSLAGWPGAYKRTGNYYSDKEDKDCWTLAPQSEYVMFPCYDKDGYLYGWRLKDKYPDRKVEAGSYPLFEGMEGFFFHRYDEKGNHQWFFRPKKEEGEEQKADILVTADKVYGKPKGKYKTLASIAKKQVDGEEVNALSDGCSMGSPYSLYTREGDNFSVVIGTEGEKKAMVANAIKHVPVVSIPGVNNFSCLFEKDENGESLIDSLKKRGMKFFILCYDADKENKDSVKQAEISLIQALKGEKLQPMIGNWKLSFEKGLDDILLAGIDMTITPA